MHAACTHCVYAGLHPGAKMLTLTLTLALTLALTLTLTLTLTLIPTVTLSRCASRVSRCTTDCLQTRRRTSPP